MLLIKTKILYSGNDGLGLFAASDIKKGQEVWTYNSNTTKTFWKSDFCRTLEKMSIESILEFINFSYIRSGPIFYLNDNSRYIKHSDDPNIAYVDDLTMVAIRNIKKDEEILKNYSLSFDKNDFNFSKKLKKAKSKDAIIEEVSRLIMRSGRPDTSFIF